MISNEMIALGYWTGTALGLFLCVLIIAFFVWVAVHKD